MGRTHRPRGAGRAPLTQDQLRARRAASATCACGESEVQSRRLSAPHTRRVVRSFVRVRGSDARRRRKQLLERRRGGELRTDRSACSAPRASAARAEGELGDNSRLARRIAHPASREIPRAGGNSPVQFVAAGRTRFPLVPSYAYSWRAPSLFLLPADRGLILATHRATQNAFRDPQTSPARRADRPPREEA